MVESKEKYKIMVLAILLGICCVLTYYFHLVFSTSVVFTHFFYIPIILASLWWKRKGLVVALFLTALLLSSHFFIRAGVDTVNDLVRAPVFIVVALIAAILSERIANAQEQLQLFSHSVNSSVDGIAMGNLKGKITYANDAFVRMFEYSREELIGNGITFIYPEDQIQKLKEAFTETLDGGWRGELVGKRKNGELFPMAVSSSRVVDDEGEVIGHMASHRDITERKRAEEQLRRFSEELESKVEERTKELAKERDYTRNLLECIPVAIAITTPEGKLIDVNRTLLEMFGYGSKEEFLKLPASAYYYDEKDGVQVLDSLERGWADNFEVRFKRKDGTFFWGSTFSIQQRTETGENRFVNAIGDVTEHKRAEDKVKEAYRLREHFLKETSHRIITPVAIIGGCTDVLLESSNLDDDQKERLRTIRERNEEVQKLVKDALAGKYLK